MPLTTSHPAAVILLTRLNLDLSALVIGSMTPDFVYFIPYCLPLSDFSHTIAGVLILCIPLGLAALSIFHYLIKNPALALIPHSHQSRLFHLTGLYTFFPLTRFMRIAAAVFIGALTHIAWDSFTHLDGWVVNQVTVLKSSVVLLGMFHVPIYLILQHGSTVVGIVLLVYAYIGWFRNAKPVKVPGSLSISIRTKIEILSTMALISAVISAVSAFSKTNIFLTTLVKLDFFRVGFIVLVSTFVLELTLFSFYWQFLRRKSGITNSE